MAVSTALCLGSRCGGSSSSSNLPSAAQAESPLVGVPCMSSDASLLSNADFSLVLVCWRLDLAAATSSEPPNSLFRRIQESGFENFSQDSFKTVACICLFAILLDSAMAPLMQESPSCAQLGA